jgi:hypothetical protein
MQPECDPFFKGLRQHLKNCISSLSAPHMLVSVTFSSEYKFIVKVYSAHFLRIQQLLYVSFLCKESKGNETSCSLPFSV